MTEPLLRADQLCRQVGDALIVNHISLDVQTGDLIAIIGRSGAGKSSFVRLLNRLDEPTSGTVYLNGADYHQLSPRELRRRVGMVMQSAFLFPGTIADNLRFGPRQRGEELSQADIDALLEQVGLKGFASRDVMHLSGGEAQRVSLARTLANRPEVLLLDEPTSALDDRAERDIEALLTRVIRDQHLTALMITHDTAQAARIANRAILIDAGRLIQDGTVEEVLHAESTLP
jgi:putative ABC transport system ATP-binding protein